MSLVKKFYCIMSLLSSAFFHSPELEPCRHCSRQRHNWFAPELDIELFVPLGQLPSVHSQQKMCLACLSHLLPPVSSHQESRNPADRVVSPLFFALEPNAKERKREGQWKTSCTGSSKFGSTSTTLLSPSHDIKRFHHIICVLTN